MRGLYLYLLSATWPSVAEALPQQATLFSIDVTCKYMPGDAGWPTADKWAQLNSTVNGQLLAAKILAQSCHGDSYDAAECAIVQNDWIWPTMHWQDPTSVQNPYWLQDTCSPYTAQNASCELGNLPSYAINVTGADDVKAGIKFAQDNNIRLVIKNTGHDFLGRSTGKGALSLWTHNLKNVSVFDYSDANYTGRAMRMGAGTQAYDAYEAADKNGVQVVGGSCPSVGLAGGYTQGAGHGPLNAAYGMAADNVLEWEVVTAGGDHLFATRSNNTDLYWALSGGGGGTYGVVLSMTVKAHEDGPVAGATLNYNSTGMDPEIFWAAVEKFNEMTPSFLDNEGLHFVYTLMNSSFSLYFVTWLNHTSGELAAVFEPYADYLDGLDITYNFDVTEDAGFHPHYLRYTPGGLDGIYAISELLGGRIVPLKTVEQNNHDLTSAFRNIASLDRGWALNAVASNLSTSRFPAFDPDQNSVLSAWRDSIFFVNVVVQWDQTAPVAEGVAAQNEMTDVVIPELNAVTPGSGVYINEADFADPNWRWDFFGANYERLLEVKKTYDPLDTFYAVASVGHDMWTAVQDGRLCRADQTTNY